MLIAHEKRKAQNPESQEQAPEKEESQNKAGDTEIK